MKIRYLFAAFLLLTINIHIAGQTLDSLLTQLDFHINESDIYIRQKEERIDRSRKELASINNEDRLFHIYQELFDEYKSYKYDSAYIYANKSLDVALQMGNEAYVMKANEAIVFCYLSSGLFKEAFEIMDNTHPVSCNKEDMSNYYSIKARLYYDIADYIREDPFVSEYTALGNQYSDSLLNVLPKYSSDWWYSLGLQQMKKRDFQNSLNAFDTILKMDGISEHMIAMTASSMGYVYWLQNNKDKAKIYMAMAAIGDVKSATKETTALRNLGTLLYESGEINRANKYVKLALEDANFYNARHRKLEVSSILPIIENERFAAVEKQRNVLMWFVICVSLLSLLLILTITIIYMQIRKLRVARHTIEKRREQLQEANNQLTEVSNIKDEYIGSSFYINSEYINKIEHLYKLANRRVAARQYEELRAMFKESDLRKERENMYTSFDETFLKLFPTFVNAYNELFQPEDRVRIENKSLTPEMRIFALIRLGILESERIANFLNYSVNTINTYKTKVKNKSIVPNEQFEQRIMEIKSVE